ncbi:uncharacterized protein DFE_1564 [Desulfovibrio ferrophilus]|uniref:Rhodanese domain-containing protein n=2 Tax=Desulfovibrio ferrophilus TaxID=241368 RepID=A0A2Z6AYL5_9BACT|nr:rhodanese-like domain-containing protein [Desulfovibrio ferrophilus]BBD08290.1 uncharacterized protein DFE_1564 [Desulfovibrio ferrophilus]
MRQHAVYAVLVVLAVFIASPQALAKDVERIEITELRDKLGASNLFVVDVRTPSSWKQSNHKIPGSIRANHKDITSLDQMIPPGSEVVLYCA